MSDTIFDNLYESSAFGQFIPLQELVDDLSSVDTFNTRFKNMFQRENILDRRINELGRRVPGFYKSYIEKYSNPVIHKEFQYKNVSGFIYNETFDSTGIPYDWNSKFGERVVLYPIRGSVFPESDSYRVDVYKNGAPLSSDHFDVYKQQTGVSIFIPRSKVADDDNIIIEIHRFWNEVTRFITECNEDLVDGFTFTAPISEFGNIYSVTDGTSLGDFILFEKKPTDGKYRLVDPLSVTIRNEIEAGINLIVNVSGTIAKDTKYCLMNNSAGWGIEYDVPSDSWLKYIPLVSSSSTDRIITPYTDAVIAESLPLPVISANELMVVVFTPDGNGFRLTPEIDFIINNNVTQYNIARELELLIRIPPESKIKVYKTEPDSWFGFSKTITELNRDGIVIVEESDIPIDKTYIDLVINNKFISKRLIENISEKSFRIIGEDINDLESSVSIESNENAFIRIRSVKNEVLTEIMNQYEDYRTDFERFLEQTEYSMNGFEHEETEVSNEWLINHNLNKEPEIHSVKDGNKAYFPTEVEYTSLNQLTLRFSSPVKGIVKMS